MIVYLSSHIGGSYKQTDGTRMPAKLSTENGLLASLQEHWKNKARVLIISSDENDIVKNDGFRDIFAAAFPMSGLSVEEMVICDRRKENIVNRMIGHIEHLEHHLAEFTGVDVAILVLIFKMDMAYI